MKKRTKKLTVLLTASLMLFACGDVKSSSQITSSSSQKPSTTSLSSQAPSSSSQAPSSSSQASSKPSSSSQAPSSSSQASSKPSSSSQAPSSSSQAPSSSSQASSKPSSSSQAPSSSSQAPSSSEQSSSTSQGSSFVEDPNFAYKDKLIRHEGASAEYIFEAECTNLETKEGLGYSGTATESGMAAYDVVENISYVSYLYKPGISLNFLVVCDRDINNAVLKAHLGGEFMHVMLDPTTYNFRVDTIITDEDLEEACGNWDAAFFDYHDEQGDDTGRYDISPWDCVNIDIDATEEQDGPALWELFQITSNLVLKKGVNCISLVTTNSINPGAGTMAAIAPVVDYISITTSANLGMYEIIDNGQGTNGCHIKT